MAKKMYYAVEKQGHTVQVIFFHSIVERRHMLALPSIFLFETHCDRVIQSVKQLVGKGNADIYRYHITVDNGDSTGICEIVERTASATDREAVLIDVKRLPRYVLTAIFNVSREFRCVDDLLLRIAKDEERKMHLA